MVDNKLTRNKYFYSTAVFAVTAVAVVILFFVVINPFFTKAQELTTEAKAKQTELKKLEDKKVKLEALKSREDELKKDAETVRNALPEQKDVGRLFIEFDNMAKASGGSIRSITEAAGGTAGTEPTATTVGSASSGLQKISYTIPVDFTDYFGFKDFVTKAETALRIIGVNDFSVNVGETGGGISASLNTTTYVRN